MESRTRAITVQLCTSSSKMRLSLSLETPGNRLSFSPPDIRGSTKRNGRESQFLREPSSPPISYSTVYIIILCWARSHKSWKSEKFPSSSSLKQRRMKKGEGKNWKENDTCGILGSLFARPTKRSSNLELSFEESRWTANGC